MSEPKWLLPEAVVAMHEIVLAEHGGSAGIRDVGLMDSALARPVNKFHDQPESALFDLAAAYSFGLAMNHPFVDANKRTALLAGLVFLRLNGVDFNAPEAEAVVTFEALAAGDVSEGELSNWFKIHSKLSE